MEERVLGYLKTGQKVIDRRDSHLSGNVTKYIKEGLKKVSIKDNRKVFEGMVKFPYVIGESSVVKVKRKDEIFFAKRVNRKGLSRFVKDRETKKRKIMSIVLLRDENVDNQYVLITAYIGKRVGPEPFDRRATGKDKREWKKLAFVEGAQEIEENTETKEIPDYWEI